jgi:hypothetical protein
MAKAKSWVLTDLSRDNVLFLRIGDQRFKLASVTTSWALNEIPQAVAVLAIGRDARRVSQKAQIHSATGLGIMKPIQVVFAPEGEWNDRGQRWPGGQKVIFEGFLQGFAYRKQRGKVQVVAHLIHWLADLGFSSTLSSLLHPSTPGSLVSPAIMPKGTGLNEGPPQFVGEHVSHNLVANTVSSDLWGGIKKFLIAVANFDQIEIRGGGACLGDGETAKNTRAQRALARIEGPAGEGDEAGNNVGYQYAQALPMEDKGLEEVQVAVADAITRATMESYLHQTFWDTLVGGILQQFGMALVPRADRALVIADTPAWRGGLWRTTRPDEYAAFEMTAITPKPLRGVGVLSNIESDTGFQTSTGPFNELGGCFAAAGDDAGDGAFMFIQAPPWLALAKSEGLFAGATTGNAQNKPTKTATTPVEGEKPKAQNPEETTTPVADLMSLYAQWVFAAKSLRGRVGDLSGKLRFDIAPGSHIRIEPSPEQFLDGVDGLAVPLFAMVNRVSITIASEAQQASTSFRLSHIRDELENTRDRTSMAAHPLLKNTIAGAPVVKEFAFG